MSGYAELKAEQRRRDGTARGVDATAEEVAADPGRR
jgi:hypothetical protein